MIDRHLSFSLPKPWENQTFETQKIGPLNFLVGPNASGKSRFAAALLAELENIQGIPRLLGTDRLSNMAPPGAFSRFYGDPLSQGYSKEHFGNFRAAGKEGSGIDTIVILEERMALRIQVEATLSHLFDREIILDWDSGNLTPKVRHKSIGEFYRLDREECHGIKELLVLLTHLYDDEHQHLIIDEPELNLHPQYQAFFMQEVRKIAGDPAIDQKKKIVFLITHSPFILDFRSEEDLNSVTSFNLEYTVPKQVRSLDLGQSSPTSFIRRLNAHHKQLFFSDNPIFVEGIHDAQFVETLMEARGESVAGAGSCIIDAGGSEELNHYLALCRTLGKKAHFLYDLDSLFRGKLRSRIKMDESIRTLMAESGHGSNLDSYCGELEKKLTGLVDLILANAVSCHVLPLLKYLHSFGKERSDWKKTSLPKARTAVVTAISRHREDLIEVVPEEAVADVEGRLDQIVSVLTTQNIRLLPGGTLERYLPCYKGDDYEISENAKRQAVNDEMQELSKPLTEEDLSSRYGELYAAVRAFPSKADVDVEPTLQNYLSDYIHELQKTVVKNPNWQVDQIQAHLNVNLPGTQEVFSIKNFCRSGGRSFSAKLEIAEMLGQPKKFALANEKTNAGMGDFVIEAAQTASESPR